MSSELPKIAIITVNFNRNQRTQKLLRSIQQANSTGIGIELVVVDNGSSDTSVEEIKRNYPTVKVLANKENLGFSEGNNAGIKFALKQNAELYLLLNNDTYVHENFLQELISAAQNHPKGGIFGPKIYFTKGFETHKEKYSPDDLGSVIWYAGGKLDWANVLGSHRGVDEVDSGQYEKLEKTDYVSGCAMFITKNVIESIGFFDRKFYLYYEDVDYCLRALKKKFEIIFVPQSKIWHDNAASSGGTGSDLQEYYQTRNRMLIGMRYAPWRTKLALFREAFNKLLRGSVTQKQALGDFLRKKYGKRT